jgi:integrase
MSSARIRYAYLKGQTWLYRRNYPKEVATLLGRKALKQSLKTSDAKVARQRAAEVNVCYEQTVDQVLSGALSLPETNSLSNSESLEWATPSELALARLRAALDLSQPVRYDQVVRSTVTVQESARRYLTLRQSELRPSGFKSVRYSVELFASKYGKRKLAELVREDGRKFLTLIAQLSPTIGKSQKTQGMSLDASVEWSHQSKVKITGRTQRRIWSQVSRWLDWCVYEGEVETNPFSAVRFEAKVRHQPYAVLSDEEVRKLLAQADPVIGKVLLVCLLSGMRAGEAAGLLREDLATKGNLGKFFLVRPNKLRLLKTDAAERHVPVHSTLDPVLAKLPSVGPLFPELKVNDITKRFAKIRQALGINRQGLVFHSTRKWFITQCERTGVPEHFTASIVGHKSARSDNGITYSIYSAGISDEQKRHIVDQIRLPGVSSP